MEETNPEPLSGKTNSPEENDKQEESSALISLEKNLADLPEDKRKEVIGFVSQTIRLHQGPLPSPETLKGYDSIVENGAERVFQMAERQSSHRMALEKEAISSEIKQSVTGQWMGFILAIVFLLASIYLAIIGHSTLAGVIGGSTILGLVSIFVIGKIWQQKE